MLEIILYAFCSTLSGFMAGLLGIGGGLVIVPALVFLLPKFGFPQDYVMHVAVATSLALIIVTSISSTYTHHKKQAVDWQLFKKLFLGLIVGALLGAYIADWLKSSYLEILFGLFVWYIAYTLFFKKNITKEESHLPGKWVLKIHGIFIAAFCTLLGMGGGSLFVPYFSHYGVSMRRAVATSSACGFPLAVAGVIGLIIVGTNEVALPAGTVGYIYLPAFFAMAIPSVAFAPLGAKLAHRLSLVLLRRIFAVFLVLVGIDMLWVPFFHLIHR
jgi:uncharacterized membrane protein YfcA